MHNVQVDNSIKKVTSLYETVQPKSTIVPSNVPQIQANVLNASNVPQNASNVTQIQPNVVQMQQNTQMQQNASDVAQIQPNVTNEVQNEVLKFLLQNREPIPISNANVIYQLKRQNKRVCILFLLLIYTIMAVFSICILITEHCSDTSLEMLLTFSCICFVMLLMSLLFIIILNKKIISFKQITEDIVCTITNVVWMIDSYLSVGIMIAEYHGADIVCMYNMHLFITICHIIKIVSSLSIIILSNHLLYATMKSYLMTYSSRLNDSI